MLIYLENNDDIEPPDDELIGEEVVDAGEGDLLGLGLQLRGLGRGEGQQEQGQGAAQGGQRGQGHGGCVVSTSRQQNTVLLNHQDADWQECGPRAGLDATGRLATQCRDDPTGSKQEEI